MQTCLDQLSVSPPILHRQSAIHRESSSTDRFCSNTQQLHRPNSPQLTDTSSLLSLSLEQTESQARNLDRRIAALLEKDPNTPRPGDISKQSSLSESSSEEDDQHLLTPLDNLVDFDLTPSQLSHNFATMQQAPSNYDSQIPNVNASTQVTHLSLGLSNSNDHQEISNQTSTSVFKSTDSSIPPSFSKSSLYQIGMVEGITPPVMSISATGNSQVGVNSVSNVVTTALEMGLGVNLASSTLMSHLSGTVPTSSALAVRRHSRPHMITFDPQYILHHDNSNGISNSPSCSSPPSFSNDVLQSIHDHCLPNETGNHDTSNCDLYRRKTTGTRENKSRFDSSRVSRHHRADTHDPILAHEPPTFKAELEKQQYYQNNYIALRNDSKILTNGLPASFILDTPLSVATSLEPDLSSCGPSSTHVGESPRLETPSLGGKGMLSPDSHPVHSISPFASVVDRAEWKTKDGLNLAQGPTQAALLGLGGASHFGPGVRAKVSEVLPALVNSIPLVEYQGETITVAEYGSLNSRSIHLMQSIISAFVERVHNNTPRKEVKPQNKKDYFSGPQSTSLESILNDPSTDCSSKVNFSIIHEDSAQSDFRSLSQMLDSNPESYLNAHWQATHDPSLQNSVFPSFVARPFASRISPPSTIHLGLSLMDLHWSHTPRNPAISLSTSAHAELTTFLTARSHEFRQGGVIILAYIARSEDTEAYPDRPKFTNSSTSDSSVEQKHARSDSNRQDSDLGDIWTVLTNTLAPCLQRLVSCGMLKSDVARDLLSLPMHARTPRQTRNVLKSVKHLWKIEWSCGLGEEISPELGSSSSSESTLHLPHEAEPLRLPHPAWKALEAGTLSRIAFAEHMIQLFKNLYESHFRLILRDKGKLSKGAVEFVLDSLWDILQSRIDDQEPCPITQCELEVQLVALRRI